MCSYVASQYVLHAGNHTSPTHTPSKNQLAMNQFGVSVLLVIGSVDTNTVDLLSIAICLVIDSMYLNATMITAVSLQVTITRERSIVGK